MKKSIILACVLFVLLSGCTEKTHTISYTVIPETFDFTVSIGGKSYPVSGGMPERKVNNVTQSKNTISWEYPDEKITVHIEQKEEYIDVRIQSLSPETNAFLFPLISAENYIIPINEGKYIPSADVHWKEYLNGMVFNTIENLSMAFFAAGYGDISVVYIMENNMNNAMHFDVQDTIGISIDHTFPSINLNKEYGFRIYVTENNPVHAAKIYKSYVKEQGGFKTLKEKEAENPNIAKLYGAPHIYLWDETVVSENDIRWAEFRKQHNSAVIAHIKMLLKTYVDGGKDSVAVFEEIDGQDYISNYQKGVISQAVSKTLLLSEFYDDSVFTKTDERIRALLDKGHEKLNGAELIELNKRLLSANMSGVFTPVEQWADDRTVDILKDMQKSGITSAWFGLNNWVQAFSKPELVSFAVENGYLIGAYDSYHSIHKNGSAQWNTALFSDESLYEGATVLLANGKKAAGFQGVGRKLNPTLSLPSVKERLSSIMETGVPFNSWFIDCDATGEVYDDYSPEHPTTKAEDIQARLERMAYIRDTYTMVIGSEGGNDFAAATIAFAHGIELPSFSWMEDDMKTNKNSPYYTGRYYSPVGGVAEKFAKQIPVKEKYKPIFLDPVYTVPLFKLVYNESVITTNHWEWSSLKIIDEIENRFMYNMLYNVPPLYHLDVFEWAAHKNTIIKQYSAFSEFSKSVINEEMTDFKILSDDRLVQMSVFAGKTAVVANFSDVPFEYDGKTVEAHSFIVLK